MKVRADQLLVARGLVPTRARAQALVLAGKVTIDGGCGARRGGAGGAFNPQSRRFDPGQSLLDTILKRLEILPQAEISGLVNLAVLAQAIVIAALVLAVPLFAPGRLRTREAGAARPPILRAGRCGERARQRASAG